MAAGLLLLASVGRLRTVVSELFQDIIPWDSPECTHPVHRERVPWLTAQDVASRRLPTLQELRGTLLSMAFIFHSPHVRCAGDPELVDTRGAPPEFCVYPPSPVEVPHKKGKVFSMYDNERLILARWLEEAPIVDATAERPHCEADVVVVPSLALHYHATHGLDWTYERCLKNDVSARYWRRVRAAFFEPCATKPLVVVNHPFSWDNPGTLALLKQLALSPHDLQSSVLISTSMSNLPSVVARHFDRRWRDGAEEELLRRELLGAFHTARHGRVEAFGGPLLVTVPRSTGISRAVSWLHPAGEFRPGRRDIAVLFSGSLERRGHFGLRGKQVVRPLLVDAMRRAGAHCWEKGCALCTRAAEPEACRARRLVYDLAAHAIFCVEPPGDTLGRSHTYVAILSGCIPVLIDGGHRSYEQRTPTWWAWRPGRARSKAREGGSARTTVDYSNFAVILHADTVNETDWVGALLRLAEDGDTLAKFRAELQRVAPLFRYAPRACGDRCDAFSMFQLVVERAHNVTTRLPRQRDGAALN